MPKKIVFRNADWIVYADRMESTGKSYTVQLNPGEKRQDGTWDWPAHMADKTWVKMETFVPAFFELLKVRNIPVDADLLTTLYALGRESVENDMFDRAAEDIGARKEDGSLNFSRMLEVDQEVQRRLGR